MTSPTFPDHFSGHADIYARYRPHYPAALYDWIAARAPGHARCWDVATGTGQAARALVGHFDEVIATDASAEQLAQARAAVGAPNLHFRQALAEDSGLEAGSVDVVTAAAAAHWFDLPRFYAEVRRVARPGALVVLWTYSATLTIAGQAPPPFLRRFVDETLGPWWPPQFALVQARYASLDFPFPPAPQPAGGFQAREDWTLEQLQGHIRTWSAYARARAAAGGAEPLAGIARELADWWAALGARTAADTLPVTWDLSVLAGYVRPHE